MTTDAQPLHPHLTQAVLAAIRHERARQDARWGEQNHPDGSASYFRPEADLLRRFAEDAVREGRLSWRHILDEEVAEARAEHEPKLLVGELVQVAAVAVGWIESILRRPGTPAGILGPLVDGGADGSLAATIEVFASVARSLQAEAAAASATADALRQELEAERLRRGVLEQQLAQLTALAAETLPSSRGSARP